MGTYPDRATIEAARDSAVTALAAAMANPKPSYTIDGQKVDWTAYRDSLQASIDWATKTLKEIDASESGPGCEETTML